MQAFASPIAYPQKNHDVVERLHGELELMDYVIAHDVQAPLRTIQNCYEELSAQLPGDAETVQTLGAETARMKIMIQGLLDYIRLETFVPNHALLDGNEIAAAAITMLEEEIRGASATITCDPLPEVFGHRGRLTRLFAHLLDNALKFHGAEPAKVHIFAQRMADRWEFCIEDNGIGIGEQHRATIFRLFQRLHGDDTYPGHGIGLALARKIVEAHGGKLWVESVPGQGSRFCFSLPAVGGNE